MSKHGSSCPNWRVLLLLDNLFFCLPTFLHPVPFHRALSASLLSDCAAAFKPAEMSPQLIPCARSDAAQTFRNSYPEDESWEGGCGMREKVLPKRAPVANQGWKCITADLGKIGVYLSLPLSTQGKRSKGHRSIASEQVTQCFASKAVLTTQACNLLPMKRNSKSFFPGEVQVMCGEAVQSQRTTLKWRVVGRKPSVHKVQHSTYFSWRISQSFSFRVTLLCVSAQEGTVFAHRLSEFIWHCVELTGKLN